MQHREGSGTLFKNDRKTAEPQPDYRGEVLLGGVLYRVSGWIKEGAKGKFMSLAVDRKPAEDAPRRQPARADVPF